VQFVFVTSRRFWIWRHLGYWPGRVGSRVTNADPVPSLVCFSMRRGIYSRPRHADVAQLPEPVPAQRRLHLDDHRTSACTYHIHRHRSRSGDAPKLWLGLHRGTVSLSLSQKLVGLKACFHYGRAALRVASDSERYVALHSAALAISLTIARNAQRSRSGNRP